MNKFLTLYRRQTLLFLILGLLGPFLWILRPFWMTLVLGLVFSVALDPFLVKIEKQVKGRTNLAIFLLLTSVVVLLIIPFGLVLLKGSQILIKQLQNLNTADSLSRLKGYQAEIMSRLEILKDYGIDIDSFQEYIWSVLEKAGQVVTNFVGNTLSEIPQTFLLLFVLLLSIISFLSMKKSYLRSVDKVTWMSAKNLNKLLVAFKGCCRTVILSSFVTGFAQALLTTIGAAIFTNADSVLIFSVTFLLSFVPVIGAGPVSLILAISAFADSNWGSGAGLLVFSAVSSVLDNILRPFLLAGTTKIPSIWALFCTIGAVLVFGLPGLFIGPLTGALTFDLLPILLDEY